MAIQNEDFLLVNRAAAPFKTKFSTFVSDIVHVGADEPDAERVSSGSLWLDTTNPTDPRLQIYDGTQWVETKAQIPEVPIVIISEDPPTEKKQGDLWWDSVNGTLYLYYIEDDYNDGAGPGTAQWVEAAPGAGGGGGASIEIGQTPPSPAKEGDLWFNQDTGTLYIYYVDPSDDEYWIEVAAPGGGGSGGANVTVSESAPATDDSTAGDLWYCTDDGRLYIYYDDGDSQQWVDASPPSVGGDGDGGGGGDYVLPTATAIRLGGIKVGNNLSVEADGTLNATTQDGTVGTLQEVTDAGNSTDNTITLGSTVDGANPGAGVTLYPAGSVYASVSDDDTAIWYGLKGGTGNPTSLITGNGNATFAGDVRNSDQNVGNDSGVGFRCGSTGYFTAQRPSTASDTDVVFNAYKGTAENIRFEASGSVEFAGSADFGSDVTVGNNSVTDNSLINIINDSGATVVGTRKTSYKNTAVGDAYLFSHSDNVCLLADTTTGEIRLAAGGDTEGVRIQKNSVTTFNDTITLDGSDGSATFAGDVISGPYTNAGGGIRLRSIGQVQIIRTGAGTLGAFEIKDGTDTNITLFNNGSATFEEFVTSNSGLGSFRTPGNTIIGGSDTYGWSVSAAGNGFASAYVGYDGSAAFASSNVLINADGSTRFIREIAVDSSASFGGDVVSGTEPAAGTDANGSKIGSDGTVRGSRATGGTLGNVFSGYGAGVLTTSIRGDGSAEFASSVSVTNFCKAERAEGTAYLGGGTFDGLSILENGNPQATIALKWDGSATFAGTGNFANTLSSGPADFSGPYSYMSSNGVGVMADLNTPMAFIDSVDGSADFAGEVTAGEFSDTDSVGSLLSATGAVMARAQAGNQVIWNGLNGTTPTSQILGDGSASFAESVEITSDTQYAGFKLSNGTNITAELVGLDSDNDSATLSLRTANDVKVRLSPNNASYIKGQDFKLGSDPINAPSITLNADGQATFQSRVAINRDGAANCLAIQSTGTDSIFLRANGDALFGGNLPSNPNITLNGSDGTASFAGNVSSEAYIYATAGTNTDEFIQLGATPFGSEQACIGFTPNGGTSYNWYITPGGGASFADRIVTGSTTGRGQFRGTCPGTVAANSSGAFAAEYDGTEVVAIQYDGSATFANRVNAGNSTLDNRAVSGSNNDASAASISGYNYDSSGPVWQGYDASVDANTATSTILADGRVIARRAFSNKGWTEITDGTWNAQDSNCFVVKTGTSTLNMPTTPYESCSGLLYFEVAVSAFSGNFRFPGGNVPSYEANSVVPYTMKKNTSGNHCCYMGKPTEVA